MGSFNANILPITDGLNLGAENQRWNLWVNLFNGSTPVNLDIVDNPWTASPEFAATTVISVQTMILSGDTVASFSSPNPCFVVIQLTQDGIGNRSFIWPTNFNGPTGIGILPDQVTTQLFYFDGTIGWPLSTGVHFP